MSGGIEPCVACLHADVPALDEPCKSCIKESAAGNLYTKFENRMMAKLTMDDPLGQRLSGVVWHCDGADRTIRIDPARPGADETATSVIGTPVDPVPVQFVAPTGYAALADVLTRALEQASAGKGAQRHAQGQAFEQQPMQQLIKLYGVGFALGQAAKKAQEAQRLPTVERQVAELLGAINYLAGAVIALEGKS